MLYEFLMLAVHIVVDTAGYIEINFISNFNCLHNCYLNVRNSIQVL